MTSSCEDKKQHAFGSVSLKFDYQKDIQTETIPENSNKNDISPVKSLDGLSILKEDIVNESFTSKLDTDTVLEDEENNKENVVIKSDIVFARITVGNAAPVTIDLSTQTSYSKSGLAVGSIIIRVELLNSSSLSLYEQSKSVTIVADQTTSASFNNWTVMNQSIQITSGIDSQYTVGDIINVVWNNTHADRTIAVQLIQNEHDNVVQNH